MKTIFFNNNQLHLSKKPKAEYAHIFQNPTKIELEYIINLFLNSKNFEGLIHGDISKTFKQIKKFFEHIKAAGGLVMNAKDEVLLIHRLGKWDLPKGKLEIGETKRRGALREVEEECGITGLIIQKKLKPSYHIYPVKGRFILKTSYWFLMRYDGNELLVPQIEENIHEAIWQDMNTFNHEEMETYPAILKVLSRSLSEKE